MKLQFHAELYNVLMTCSDEGMWVENIYNLSGL
jgi:hypothetical protein